MKGHTINQLLTNSIIVCVRSVNPSNSIFSLIMRLVSVYDEGCLILLNQLNEQQ